MAVSIDRSAIECGGAHIRAHSRHLATVLTISGAIHALNVDRVSECSRRFILDDLPFVLDLSRVTSFDVSGISFLRRVEEDCRAAGVQWALIAGTEVDDVLRIDDEDAFPVADSLPEALNHFADAIVTRRRLLLPLLAKSA